MSATTPRAGWLAPAGRIIAAVPPASGAIVMGTGIVSIDLKIDGDETLSRALLALAAVVWAGLALLAFGRVLGDRPRASLEAASPASLTGVAGTAVLGTRIALLGWHAIALTLLGAALALWLALVPRVLRAWTLPTVGVSFLLVVSTESLAVLGAGIAVRERAAWLAAASLAAVAVGIGAYVPVLARFDVRQLLEGRGDHWVAGGALAIAALACGDASEAARTAGSLHALAGGLRVAALALWAAAAAWLPALLAGELAARRLGYDLERWSTVFPVGMYAACSFVVGNIERIGALVDFARVWTWVGFACWLVAFGVLLRRGYGLWTAAAREIASDRSHPGSPWPASVRRNPGRRPRSKS